MTQTELQLLQRSAKLCTARNQLYAQIQDLQKKCEKAKNGVISDPKCAAQKAAQKYLEEKKPSKLSHLFIALAVAMVPYAVLGILAELIGGFFSFLALVATGGTFVYVYMKQDKTYQAKLLAQYEAHYLGEYQRISRENQTRYEALNAQLMPLRQQYAQLESTMRDRSKCSIPAQYWHCGALLCEMVESGQSDSLQQAILLYEQRLYNQQLAQQLQAQADARRWTQLQGMMTRNLAAELDQKRRDQFYDAADWMILAELLESN